MPNDGGWEYGTNLDYMKDISNYWVKDFNWKKHEAQINKFPNFTTIVDDIEMHFIHEKGSGSNPNSIASYAWLARISCRIFTYY